MHENVFAHMIANHVPSIRAKSILCYLNYGVLETLKVKNTTINMYILIASDHCELKYYRYQHPSGSGKYLRCYSIGPVLNHSLWLLNIRSTQYYFARDKGTWFLDVGLVEVYKCIQQNQCFEEGITKACILV